MAAVPLPESRFEDANLLIPGRKPITRVMVDKTHRFGDCVNFFMLGENYDAVGGRHPLTYNNDSGSSWISQPDNGIYGATLNGDTGNHQHIHTHDNNWCPTTNDFTFMFHMRHNVSGFDPVSLFDYSSNNFGIRCEIWESSGAYLLYWEHSQSGASQGGSTTLSSSVIGTPIVFVVTCIGSAINVACNQSNAIHQIAVSYTAPDAATAPYALGNIFTSAWHGGRNLEGAIYSAAKWPYSMTNTQLSEIAYNPYQCLIPA